MGPKRSSAASQKALLLRQADRAADAALLLKKLAGGSAASALKGEQLVTVSRELCSVIEASTATMSDGDRSVLLLSITGEGGLLQLVSKVLAGRKRLRDWKQQEHSSKVCALLRAATATLRLLVLVARNKGVHYLSPGTAAAVEAQLDKADTLHTTAAAQSEVSQLLHACLQQQQQQAEGLQQLQQLACELLTFWVEAHSVWFAHGGRSRAGSAGPAAFMQQPVELADVLAQTLTADSPAEQCVVIAQVAYGASSIIVPPGWNDEVYAARHAIWDLPAQLQLCVMMLVLHSYNLQLSSNSSTSTSSTGSSSNQVAAVAAAPSQACEQQQDDQQQQHQREQLAAVTLQVWTAAGLPAAALPAFAAAFRGHVAAASEVTGAVTDLRASTPEELDNVVQWLCSCFDDNFEPEATGARLYRTQPLTALPNRKFDDLSRHQQQLLQAVVWPLPQLLLQTALLHGQGSHGTVANMALVAARTLGVWQLSGLYAAAAAVSAPAASSSSSKGRQSAPAAAVQPLQPLQQQLPVLLSCWLLLMQQMLLQPELGLIWQAASSRVQLTPGGNVEAALLGKHCKCLSSITPPCCAAGSCGAAAQTSSSGQSGTDSRSHSFVCVSCSTANAVTCLLAVLQQLGGLHSASPLGDGALGDSVLSVLQAAWCSKGAGVVLVLEALMRAVLPHHAACLDSHLPRLYRELGERVAAEAFWSSKPTATLRVQLADCLAFGVEECEAGGLLLHLPAAVLDGAPQLQARLFPFLATASKLSRCQPKQGASLALPAVSARLQCAATASQAASAAAARGGPGAEAAQEQLVGWLFLMGCFMLEAAAALQLLCQPGPQSERLEGRCLGIFFAVCQASTACVPAATVTAADAAAAGAVTAQPATQLLTSLHQQLSGPGGSSSSGSGAGEVVASASSSSDVAPEQNLGSLVGSVCSLAADNIKLFLLTGKFDGDAAVSITAADLHSPEGQQGAQQMENAPDLAACVDIWRHCGVMQLLRQHLQQLGAGLCAALPVPWCCNNVDGCTNMAGASEAQLVGGKACVCGGCRVARYCSRSCQMAHQQQHMPICQRLAAATAAIAVTLAS